MSDKTEHLLARWYSAKAAEKEVIAKRREIEDELSLILLDGPAESSITRTYGKYKMKVVTRYTRKVDGDKLQDIASEHGISEHLSTLFRWKPEIDAKAWQAADEKITSPLLEAITTKPGRASYSVTIVEED